MKASWLVAILLLLLTAALFQLAAQQADTDQKPIDQVKAVAGGTGFNSVFATMMAMACPKTLPRR